jgi:hypothetical protein
MTRDIPFLYAQEAYDDWIAQLAEYEITVLEEERVTHTDGEVTEDDIFESVMHSGALQWYYTTLPTEILRYTNSQPASVTVTIPDESAVNAEQNYMARCVRDDVLREVRAHFEQSMYVVR